MTSIVQQFKAILWPPFSIFRTYFRPFLLIFETIYHSSRCFIFIFVCHFYRFSTLKPHKIDRNGIKKVQNNPFIDLKINILTFSLISNTFTYYSCSTYKLINAIIFFIIIKIKLFANYTIFFYAIVSILY